MRDGWAAVLAAALLYALACPPCELSAAAWLVPGLLLAAVRGSFNRAALVRGCVFALAFGCLQTGLTQVASVEHSLPDPAAGWWAVQPAGAAPYALLVVVYAWASGSVSARVRPVMASWLWVGAEVLRTALFSATSTLGHTQIGSGWMIQVADLGGVHAVTFVMVLISVGCAELLIESSRNRGLGHPARV